MPQALILFAHGARDPAWADPVRRVRAAVGQLSPETRVELAFLEFLQPSLRACAEELLAAGCERIAILPLFIAQGGHLRHDVPLLVEDLRRRHPHAHLELHAAVGEAAAVIQAMAEHAVQLAHRHS